MAGFIPPATLEQIRAASDIVDVISASVPLKRSGATFTARCPFHNEKTPSFHVNPRKQTFHCFGCQKGGDVFTFVREYESLDFVEAVKRLADRARIPINFDNDPQFREKQFLKDQLLAIHDQITDRWHHCLLAEAAGLRARDYLAERGVSPDAIKLFRLGYAPDAWDDSINWARSKKIDPNLLEQCGIAVRKEETGTSYGRWRDRLMFPICDEQGRVIGFSGRVLPGSEDPRKYVNSPETPLFTKSRVMFGLDKSKRALLDKQFAIICEGQLDLISCFMAGVQNVVAPQGTALTQEHTRILKRYVNEVVLCFDSDAAGQKATVRALDDVLGSGLAVRVATIPAPHDPDSFLKEFGPAAFQEHIEKADGFFDFYLGYLCRLNDVQTDKGQSVVLAAMAEAVLKTNDPTLFDKYAQRTAARLGISGLSALERFRKAKEPARSREEEFETSLPPEFEEEAPARPNTQELWVLKITLQHDETLDWTRSHLDPEWIVHPHAREILLHRLATDADGHPIQPAAILDALTSVHAKRLLTESLAEDRAIPNPAQQLVDLTTRLRNAAIDREFASITQRLADPALPPEELKPLILEQTRLRQMKRSPLSPLTF